MDPWIREPSKSHGSADSGDEPSPIVGLHTDSSEASQGSSDAYDSNEDGTSSDNNGCRKAEDLEGELARSLSDVDVAIPIDSEHALDSSY